MNTDTDALTERLWEAVTEVRDQHFRAVNDAPSTEVVAAILPIIAAEVRKAKAEALREAAEELFYDGDYDVEMRGYHQLYDRAAEYETGDQR